MSPIVNILTITMHIMITIPIVIPIAIPIVIPAVTCELSEYKIYMYTHST